MQPIRTFFRRCRELFQRDTAEADMAEQIRLHLEQSSDQNIARGMSPEDARYAALRKFGGVEQVKENARQERGWIWIEQTLQDLRFGARSLRKSPGFTTVVVVTLALGVGAATAIFSGVNALILRSLPVRDPEQLVNVVITAPNDPGVFSYPLYADLRDQGSIFAGKLIAASGTPERRMVATGMGGTETESVKAQQITGNFFSVLGVPAILGRMISENDDRVGDTPAVVVLSHAFWQRRFGSDASILGKTIVLDETPFVVVGVTAPGFIGTEVGRPPDLWWPIRLSGRVDVADRTRLEGSRWLYVLGRLAPGTSREQASAELNSLFFRRRQAGITSPPKNSFEAEIRRRLAEQRIEIRPGAAGYGMFRSQFRESLFILFSAAVAVLLAACANIAGLMLARGAARLREFEVRAALGAGRSRLIRQLMSENLLLALIGGSLGFLCAQGGTALLGAYLVGGLFSLELRPDGQVFGFALAATVMAAVIFGLAPALRFSRIDLTTALKGQSSTVIVGGKGRLNQILVVAQITFSFVLLTGTGLLVRTLQNLRSLETGFRHDNLLLFDVELSQRSTTSQRDQLFAKILSRIENLPGVVGTTMLSPRLLSGMHGGRLLSADDYVPKPGEILEAKVLRGGPRFGATLGFNFLRGRDFKPEDCEPSAPRVVLINETLARHFFPQADPVGRKINGAEIIGVVSDPKNLSLRDPPGFVCYDPIVRGSRSTSATMTFALGTGSNPLGLAATIRTMVRDVEPAARVADLQTMGTIIEQSLFRERAVAQLSGLFSVFSLVLLGLGLYGLLSFGVVRRTREIGVRVALGAEVCDITGLILKQGLGLVIAGCVMGVGGAVATMRFMSAFIYDVRPTDPLVIGGAGLLVLCTAVVACWLPARRAAKVDPLLALRCE